MSPTILPKLLHSDLVLDQMTVCNLLELHEFKFNPRKIAKPQIEWQSSLRVADQISIKDSMEKRNQESGRMDTPRVMLFFR